LTSKINTAEPQGQGIGNDSQSITSVGPPTSENEEWAWMIAEDPAFYLSTGRAENKGV
jgi:hypothetical protein